VPSNFINSPWKMANLDDVLILKIFINIKTILLWTRNLTQTQGRVNFGIWICNAFRACQMFYRWFKKRESTVAKPSLFAIKIKQKRNMPWGQIHLFFLDPPFHYIWGERQFLWTPYIFQRIINLVYSFILKYFWILNFLLIFFIVLDIQNANVGNIVDNKKWILKKLMMKFA